MAETEQFISLQQLFIKRLPLKVRQIAHHWHQLTSHGWLAEDIENMKQHLSKLIESTKASGVIPVHEQAIALYHFFQTVNTEGDLEFFQHQVDMQLIHLRALATLDLQTGLPNKNQVLELLEIELSRSQRLSIDLSLVLITLDAFATGEEGSLEAQNKAERLIFTFIDMVQMRLRKTDIIGRVDPVTFALIFPEATTESAKQVLDTLTTQFNVEVLEDEDVWSPNWQVGIAEAGALSTSKTMFDAADMALAEAQPGREDFYAAMIDPGLQA